MLKCYFCDKKATILIELTNGEKEWTCFSCRDAYKEKVEKQRKFDIDKEDKNKTSSATLILCHFFRNYYPQQDLTNEVIHELVLNQIVPLLYFHLIQST